MLAHCVIMPIQIICLFFRIKKNGGGGCQKKCHSHVHVFVFYAISNREDVFVKNKNNVL